MAAYQQKGDFEVVRVKGNVQKNGGNVVTYFCTPDMRVLHFVVGPVSAGKLMDEAAWAHRVYDTTRQRTVGKLNKVQMTKATRNQLATVRKEHAEMIAGDETSILRQMAASRANYLKSQRQATPYRQASYGRKPAKKAPAERWEPLLWSLGGSNEERVHRLLAFDPLPPLAAVDTTVFRRLAGQTVNDQDGSVGRAIADLQRAEKTGRPVMFVFYRHWQGWRNSQQRKMLRQSPNNKLIAQFTVINLPINEQPALSAHLPGFELPTVGENASVQIVLADCRLKQLSVVSDRVEPQVFAATLRRAVAENQIAFAEHLVESERRLDAKRVLYKARRSDDRGVAAKAETMLAKLLAKND